MSLSAKPIRDEVADTPGLTEKKMFGGIGWMIHGNMAAGAHNDGKLMIRCSKEDHDAMAAEPGAQGVIPAHSEDPTDVSGSGARKSTPPSPSWKTKRSSET